MVAKVARRIILVHAVTRDYHNTLPQSLVNMLMTKRNIYINNCNLYLANYT